MRTLEERERLAYISGRVEEAAALREATDPVDERILELEHENESLKTEVEDLEHQLDETENGR